MVPPDYHWEKVQRILEGDAMTDGWEWRGAPEEGDKHE